MDEMRRLSGSAAGNDRAGGTEEMLGVRRLSGSAAGNDRAGGIEEMLGVRRLSGNWSNGHTLRSPGGRDAVLTR